MCISWVWVGIRVRVTIRYVIIIRRVWISSIECSGICVEGIGIGIESGSGSVERVFVNKTHWKWLLIEYKMVFHLSL